MTAESDPTHSRASSVPEDGSADSGARSHREIDPPSREELLRVRDRDPQALGRFFDKYFPQVYGIVARLLGDRALAEDAAQDVFVKVHRAIERLDPERDPGPWLTTIAYNVCRDHWRAGATKMQRRSSSIDDKPEVAHRLRDGGLDPEETALLGERERMVQAALLELPEGAREVIVLHDYEGLTHERIAEMLEVSHAAVRKRYSRAVQALGEILRGRLES